MKNKHSEMIEKLYGQPAELPTKVKNAVEVYNDDTILLYGFLDLDQRYNFCSNWVAITKCHLFVINEQSPPKSLAWRDFSRIKENISPGFIRWDILKAKNKNKNKNENNETLWATIYFTHRQKIIMGHIKFWAEEFLKDSNKNVEIPDLSESSEKAYQVGVLKKMIEARDGDAHNTSSIIWRLLGYLRPYNPNPRLTFLQFGKAQSTFFSARNKAELVHRDRRVAPFFRLTSKIYK